MTAQTTQQKDMMVSGQRIADLFKRFSEGEEKFHISQYTQKSFVGKFLTVERFGVEHEVEYCFVNDELEINSIDGNMYIENTYTKEFIEAIEQEVIKYSNCENDEDYDNWFQTAV